MTRKLLLFLAIAGWSLALSTPIHASEDGSAKEAFDEGREAYEAAETVEEKLAIVEDFLERYPESDYTDNALRLAVEHLADDLKDPQRAEKLVTTTLAKIEGEEVRKQVLFRLAGLYVDSSEKEKFIALTEDLEKRHELKYADLYDLNEKAIMIGAWDRVLAQSAKAMPLASAAQYRSDYPDMEITEEALELRGRRRKGLILAQKGWAQVKLGKTDEGARTLRGALEYTGSNYVGVPDTDAKKYLGKALLAQGQYKDAVAMLAPDAIQGGKEDALASLKNAYAGLNGGEKGFEEFTWRLRLDGARKVDSFTLKDYQDKLFDFAGLDGQVVLLAFWFPT